MSFEKFTLRFDQYKNVGIGNCRIPHGRLGMMAVYEMVKNSVGIFLLVSYLFERFGARAFLGI